MFVDTPGMHKPRTLLGERLNDTAASALGDVDVACLVIDATAPVGPGDRFIASRLRKHSLVVVNKVLQVVELTKLDRVFEFCSVEDMLHLVHCAEARKSTSVVSKSRDIMLLLNPASCAQDAPAAATGEKFLVAAP